MLFLTIVAIFANFIVLNYSETGKHESPKWIEEPKNQSVLAGEPMYLHCQTTGSPTPQVTWLKQKGGTSTEFMPLVNHRGRFQFLINGTLWTQSTLPSDEGYYMCKSENGVGSPLSKTIFLTVNARTTILNGTNFRKLYGMQYQGGCDELIKEFGCMSKCKSLGFPVFRISEDCKCYCFDEKTTTSLPYFQWRTTRKPISIPKTRPPALYEVAPLFTTIMITTTPPPMIKNCDKK